MIKGRAIVVFGNIAAGKSSICELIKDLLPEYDLVSADEFRKNIEPGAGSDHHVHSMVCNKLATCSNVILETTGIGKFYSRYLQSLFDKKINYILIDTPPAICLQRFDRRKRNGHVQPYLPFASDVRETIYRFDTSFRVMKRDAIINNAAALISKPELNKIICAF